MTREDRMFRPRSCLGTPAALAPGLRFGEPRWGGAGLVDASTGAPSRIEFPQDDLLNDGEGIPQRRAPGDVDRELSR